jgi:dolichol kinase
MQPPTAPSSPPPAAPSSAHTPQLGPERPQNLKRSAFHALWGLFAVYLAERYLSPLGLKVVAGSFTLTAWGLEALKRSGARGEALFDALFGAITHTHERHKINSATWYCSAVFLSTLLFSPRAITLSVLCLAVGDPAAGYVGRRWGRVRLIGRRTLEGSLAFAVTATLSASALLSWAHADVQGALWVASAAGCAGALAELLSGRWLDDNLTVPLAAAAAATLALGAQG